MFGIIAGLLAMMFAQGTMKPKLALDLAGGTTVTLKAVTEKGKTPPAEQMNQAKRIMDDRVNGLGVAEAQVNRQGGDIIVVQVPGEGQQRVAALIGTTAQLQFRQVFAVGNGAPSAPPVASPSPSASPTGTAATGKNGKKKGANATASPSSSVSPGAASTPRGRAVSQALSSGNAADAPTAPSSSAKPSPSATASTPAPVPTTPAPQPGGEFAGIDDKAVIAQFQQLTCQGKNYKVPGADDVSRKWVVACDKEGTTKYILGPVRVQGQQISGANPLPPDPTQLQSSWQVSLTFKSEGARQFAEVTSDAYKAPAGTPQRQVAIVLDGGVVSAPSIDNGPIGDGRANIYGPPESFTQQYATDLSNVLRYGALPLKFEQQSIDSVSASLGSDQLHAGLLAGGIGLALVVLYSLLYYRGLGFVSVFSLVVAGGLTYELVCLLGKLIGFRLSLAGIAGLIVAIGITADSFIIYFERLRDEVREGRSLRSAVERGWERARRTVLVADAVSFLAAAVLYLVSVGGVKGFAFTLGLTTLLDVLVVFLFTKPMVSYLASFKFFNRGHPLSGLDPRRLGGKTAPSSAAGAGRPVTKEA